MNLSREEIANLIKDLEGKILITTHKNPDGDAIGSSLGWHNFLKRLGKNVKIIYKDRVPFFFDFLPGIEEINVKEEITEEFDWVIITDVSELKRTGFEYIPAKKSIVIDHHITAEPFADYSIVEPEISSTCELSYEIMKLINPALIEYPVALPIYTGIVTDTGKFGYNNTSPTTHKIAAELIEKGIDPYVVTKNIFERNRIQKFKLLELVLKTLDFSIGNKVAHITLFKKFLEESGAYPEESEGFINYPRSIIGVEVAVFFKEIDENYWKVSLRSKGNVNVAEVAKRMGGGGHKMASGFETRCSLEEIKNKLFKELELAIESAEFERMDRLP
ncbi:DHH family phosphoesterase [Desulfurobacterium thermolithotrophum]|uniref:DHH family phosphoesterase n=1 Tax=Desulfurobacterium thermolithotrophum TaxID=64160 RepID=UPI0013D47B53|nr:bifunctional oligoribonuclease/PAP phosphatase NrnA [Desulfurobacterium thermolithotrophum]